VAPGLTRGTVAAPAAGRARAGWGVGPVAAPEAAASRAPGGDRSRRRRLLLAARQARVGGARSVAAPWGSGGSAPEVERVESAGGRGAHGFRYEQGVIWVFRNFSPSIFQNEYYNHCGDHWQRCTLKMCPAVKTILSNVMWQKSTL
jgi:hypothetical protein